MSDDSLPMIDKPPKHQCSICAGPLKRWTGKYHNGYFWCPHCRAREMTAKEEGDALYEALNEYETWQREWN